MYRTLVTLSLILVFGSSAYMSISGLLSIFPDNIYIIISMGLGMELGKILIISHLYRNWKKITATFKTCGIFIIFILTFLTSFELMGFLSQCHQKNIESNHIIKLQIDALVTEEAILKSEVNKLDIILNGFPKTHVTKKIRERENSGYYLKQKRLIEIVKQKSELGVKLISEDNKSNPVSAVAIIFNLKDSEIISLFIPLLVLILEPLSIGLTIAVNSAWVGHKDVSPKKRTSSKKQNLTEELQKTQKKYKLSVAKIANITGRKKLKTCKDWLNGTIPTPPRALAEIQAWVEKEYIKPDG